METLPKSFAYWHAVERIKRLEAKIEQLQIECDQWQKKLTEDAWPEIERLRAENAQLRASLEHMVDVYGSLADLGAGRPALDQARQALGRPPQ